MWLYVTKGCRKFLITYCNQSVILGLKLTIWSKNGLKLTKNHNVNGYSDLWDFISKALYSPFVGNVVYFAFVQSEVWLTDIYPHDIYPRDFYPRKFTRTPFCNFCLQLIFCKYFLYFNFFHSIMRWKFWRLNNFRSQSWSQFIFFPFLITSIVFSIISLIKDHLTKSQKISLMLYIGILGPKFFYELYSTFTKHSLVLVNYSRRDWHEIFFIFIIK